MRESESGVRNGGNKTRERWKAAGVCVDCGQLRVSKSRCAACLARARDAARRYRERRSAEQAARALARMRTRHKARAVERKAAQQCVRCGGVLPRDVFQRRAHEGERFGTWFVLCGDCRERGRASWLRACARRWGIEDGPVRAEKAWTLGRAVAPLPGGGTCFVLRVDFPTREALTRLLAQFHAAEEARGLPRNTHALSAAVRGAVRRFAREPVPLPRGPSGLMRYVARVNLDSETRDIVQRQAERFGGNESATLRAMVRTAAFPFVGGNGRAARIGERTAGKTGPPV